MNYQIAIPTFNRPKIIRERSLALLNRHNIDKNKIKIFVESEEMKESYGDLSSQYEFIITGAKGICSTRNALQYYYFDKDIRNVLFMDDDIEDLMDMKNPLENLDEFIINGFNETEKLGFNIWGVSPFHNTFYMKPITSTNLKYICGAFYGEIFDKNKDMVLSDVDHFEDFQKSMECFLRDGGVVRYNGIALKTKYFEQKGGICESVGGLPKRKIMMDINKTLASVPW